MLGNTFTDVKIKEKNTKFIPLFNFFGALFKTQYPELKIPIVDMFSLSL